MKALIATDLLQHLKEESVALLDQIDAMYQHTPLELLETNDGPNRWNTLQVLEHLNTYYRYYIPLIEKAMAEASNKQAGPSKHFKPGWLGGYFTKSMLPRQGKVTNKIKAMKAHSPSPDLDKERVMTEFMQWQRQFILLIERGRQVDLNKIRIPISIAQFIKLKLGDVFMFIAAHNQRHWVQIEKLLGRLPVALG
ncbi:MAG TPA: DinB family protein [Flavihumibacter sp.]|jgi:hypothetical protein